MGRRCPALDSRPQPRAESFWLLEAFRRLSRHRSGGGFGPGPITLPDILAYCRLVGIENADDREVLIDVIGAMDDEYLRWNDERGRERQESNARARN